MFKKILIANRGESGRDVGESAKPHGLARKAHAGTFTSIEVGHV